MANTIITTNTVTSTAVTLASNDNFLLLDGASYVNTSTSNGINIAAANNVDIIINGDYIYLGTLDAIRGQPTDNNTVITVSSTGSIVTDGSKEMIFLQGSNSTVTNDGFMSGAAVTITGDDTDFYNNGTIRGTTNFTSVFLTGDNSFLDNTGIISGNVGARVGNNGTIINSGEISATDNAVFGAGSTFYLFNSGMIVSEIGFAVITGTITEANIINAGQIIGELNIRGDNADITNSGDIFGLVNLSGDTARFDGRDSDSANEVFGGLGSDTLIGGTSDDNLNGSEGNDRLFGSDGDDVLLGSAGDDSLYGGAGSDDINGGLDNDAIKAGDGDDTVLGGDGNDIINGQAGNDMLMGDSGSDLILGGRGDDTLEGNGRGDTLDGGVGDDVMTGGGAGDTFVIRRVNNGDDIVTDFQNGSDVVDISALGILNFSRITNAGALDQDTDSVTIDLSLLNGTGSITLQGVQISDMNGADFIF